MRYTVTFDGVPVGFADLIGAPRVTGPLFALPAFESSGLRRVAGRVGLAVRLLSWGRAPRAAVARALSGAATGALLAGELQQSPEANSRTRELFQRVARELFSGFARVRHYRVGPEALGGLRAGQRLVTIGLRSPREYDLSESHRPHDDR